MKKSIIVIVLIALVMSLFSVTVFASEDIDKNQSHTVADVTENMDYEETEAISYTTSGGVCFYLSDYQIYIDDFKGIEFTTSQEVIDHIYNVGERRLRQRDATYPILGRVLTADEIALLASHPLYVFKVQELSEEAVNAAAYFFPNNHGDGQIGNAYQHAYWTALLYHETDPDFALAFTDAHENYYENPIVDKGMDLTNNHFAHSVCESWNLSNSNYSRAVVSDRILTLVDYGYLIYIIRNYRYISHTIYYAETGVTRYVYATADLYAYTDSTEPYNIPEPTHEIVSPLPGGPVVRP